MESAALTSSYRARDLAVLYAAWLALFLYVLSRAWVAEDAYITFRVIDNFMHGYGLRWNVAERVQAYTHPLWLLLQLPIDAALGNLFFANIFLSVVCTMAAVLVALAGARKPPLVTLIVFFLPLFVSKSFIDYSTSGLENPLSYLLFAAFGYVFLQKREDAHFWFYCSAVIALSLFNRLDTIFLYAPALTYLAAKNLRAVRWKQVWLGATPLMAWFAFSLFYYGFLFPNTKYAKLDTGLGLWLYLGQGLYYAKYLLVLDTAGALILAFSLLFFLHRRTPALPFSIALGIAFYALYVIAIGGDYMAGRFWALPIFASVWLCHAFFPSRLRADWLMVIACVLLTAYFVPPLLRDIRSDCALCIPLKGRVINASHTFRANDLFTQFFPPRIRKEGAYPFANRGRVLAAESPAVKVLYFIGMPGYYAGPSVTIVDMLGLADPLLARLPASKKQSFFIGHFQRDIPKGYPYMLKTGSFDRMAPGLAKYDEELQIITRGDLWDGERLKTILLFNLGYYDHWKRDYIHNHPA